jgi:quinoprotein glucose dehydrogenase
MIIRNVSCKTFFLLLIAMAGCKNAPEEKYVKVINPDSALVRAKAIESEMNFEIADGFSIRLWASDSLVADPVSLFVDNQGILFYTRTNRQKHSEFDIRGHQDWESESMKFKTYEDRSAFLKKALSPENSNSNLWLADLNHDGNHDWRDLTVEQEEIYRIEDRSGDGLADYSKMILKDFHQEITDVAGAIMTIDNDLYIGVSPDLWRLKDKDGDGYYEEKQSISNGYGVHIGFGGHGMSGLEMGPEGKIYWQIGDLGFSGKDAAGNKLEYPNTGVIVRANPDGSDFEVFAYGNRNTHEFVFDDYGNLITEDNDGDHPGELERLLYVVEGQDIGWRINWQFGKYNDPDNNTYKVWMDEKMYLPRFKDQAAYFIPPLANYVSGPTGMLYNPGTALSKEWKNTFFVGEFVGNPTQSGIHAFKLKPDGASFKLADHKPILKGLLATGVDFGPDGALYLADWVMGWNTKNYGRIWKFDVTNPDTITRNQTKQLLAKDFSEDVDESLGDLLKHEDKRVRQKAQFELAKRSAKGFDVFKKAIIQTDHQLARVHGIWGITQLSRNNPKYAESLLPLLNDRDDEIKAQAARWLGDLKFNDSAPALIPLLQDTNSRVRFFAAEALGRMQYQPAILPIIEMLRTNNDKDVYLRHAGSLALARIGKAESLTTLTSDPSTAVRMAAVLALRRMRHAGIAGFLNDKDELIVTETARAINDDENITDALPALGDVLLTTSFKNEPLIRRAINANLEVGSDKALRNLITYSERQHAPLSLRLECLSAISTWTKPSIFDRVDGRYHGELTRDAAQTTPATSSLTKLMSNKVAAIRVASIKAISKLRVEGVGQALYDKLKKDPDASVRVEALKAMAALGSKELNTSIKSGIADNDKTVRTTSLALLSKSEMKPEEKVSLLNDVIQHRTIEEKQAAITALSNIPAVNGQAVLDQLMSMAEKNKLPLELNIEFSEAIASSKSENLINRYNKLKTASRDTLFFEYQGALSGGDANRGRAVFFNNENSQCTRCHSFDDMGGNAGPRLNGVGARLTKNQILEALIQPSKRIAPGFGSINLELKNGKKLSGKLQSENAFAYVIKPGQRSDTTILKQDVAQSKLSGSSMPPMNLLLTKREIRDLISFLSTLKEN